MNPMVLVRARSSSSLDEDELSELLVRGEVDPGTHQIAEAETGEVSRHDLRIDIWIAGCPPSMSFPVALVNRSGLPRSRLALD